MLAVRAEFLLAVTVPLCPEHGVMACMQFEQPLPRSPQSPPLPRSPSPCMHMRRAFGAAGTAPTAPGQPLAWKPFLECSPFTAQSLPLVPQGFWRGWHSSYNAWLVRYMYVPLGGTAWRLLAIWPIFFFVSAPPFGLCLITLSSPLWYGGRELLPQGRWGQHLPSLSGEGPSWGVRKGPACAPPPPPPLP